MADSPARKEALRALDEWADAADSPALSVPARWVLVLQHLERCRDQRPVGLDPFVIPLA